MRCPLQHIDNLLPRPHPNLLYPSLQIGDKVYMTIQPHSDLTPKWQGFLHCNSADPYCCKIKRNHCLGIHHWLIKVMQPHDENAFQTKTYQVSHTGLTTLKFSQLPPAPTADVWACGFHGCNYSWNNFWQISGSWVLKDPRSNMLKIISPPCGYRESFIMFTPLKSNTFP